MNLLAQFSLSEILMAMLVWFLAGFAVAYFFFPKDTPQQKALKKVNK